MRSLPSPLPDMPSRARASVEEHHSRFTGKGGDYFPIWLMNSLGTLLTFGLYGPWAKIRRLKFFYRHTQIGDLGGLDFHGKPTSILLGRILFMACAGIYASSSAYFIIKVSLIVLFCAALPWMMFSSIRFYTNNTSWRGVHFRFHGSPATLYVIVLGALAVPALFYFLMSHILHAENLKALGLVAGFLLVLLVILFPPLLGGFLWAFWRYRVNNTSLGSARFSLPISRGAFVIKFFLGGILIGALLMLFLSLANLNWVNYTISLLSDSPVSRVAVTILMLMVAVLMFMVVSFIFYFSLVAHVQNLVFNHARLEENEFRSNLQLMRWLATSVTNILLTIISFKLYTPFAEVRMAKLRVESVSLLADARLLNIVNIPPAKSEAIGAEMSIFDFEFGL